jgi:hypothetical protein
VTSVGADPRRVEEAYAASYPPSLWSGPATGAREGTPGTWLPPGAIAPASFADLVAGVPNPVIAVPTATWDAASYVVGRPSTGAVYAATWNGFDWVELPNLDRVGDFTIAQVEEWVEAHPDQVDEVLAAEQARGDDARVTLVAWLENRQEYP